MTEVVKLSHRLHTLGSLGFREQLRPIRKQTSSRTAELCRVGMVLAGGEIPNPQLASMFHLITNSPEEKGRLLIIVHTLVKILKPSKHSEECEEERKSAAPHPNGGGS